MAEFLVTWSIDVEAESPDEAASKARYYQTKRGTIATVFSVYSSNPHDHVEHEFICKVDLSATEEDDLPYICLCGERYEEIGSVQCCLAKNHGEESLNKTAPS